MTHKLVETVFVGFRVRYAAHQTRVDALHAEIVRSGVHFPLTIVFPLDYARVTWSSEDSMPLFDAPHRSPVLAIQYVRE